MYDGFDLGEWIAFYRNKWNQGKLDKRRQEMLKALGIERFPAEKQWNQMYHLAEEYYNQNGCMEVGYTYRTDDGILLGAWIDKQKKLKDKLPIEQQEKLKVLGL